MLLLELLLKHNIYPQVQAIASNYCTQHCNYTEDDDIMSCSLLYLDFR